MMPTFNIFSNTKNWNKNYGYSANWRMGLHISYAGRIVYILTFKHNARSSCWARTDVRSHNWGTDI